MKRHSRRGVTAIEYALLASLVALASTTALVALGSSLIEPHDEVTNTLTTGSGGGGDSLSEAYSKYDADGSGDMDYCEYRDYIRDLVDAGTLTFSEGVTKKSEFYTTYCWTCTISEAEFRGLLSS